MLNDFLTSINWLDIVLVIILVRLVYIGVAQGLVVEFFKTVGVLFAGFIGLHYYGHLAKVAYEALVIPEDIGKVLAFVLLTSVTVFIFKFVREGWLLILKVDAKSGISHYGGGILGAVRALLVSGLILYGVLLVGNQNLSLFARQGLCGHYLLTLQPRLYGVIFDNLITKFFPNEERNPEVFKIIQEKIEL